MTQIRLRAWLTLCLLGLTTLASAADDGGTWPTTWTLTTFGPIATPADAEASYRKALAAIEAAGGGLLLVPADTAAAANLENTSRWSHSVKPESNDLRDWKVGPGVMVLDLRGGNMRWRVPQHTDKGSRGGMIFNRVMRLPAGDSLQHWTEEAVLAIENDVIHGPVNYLDWLVAPVEPGPDARFYVPQGRNLFPGMYLNAHEGPGYGGKVERITVKTVGWDMEKKLYYFTAHANLAHLAGAIVQNKSHTPALRIENNLHASNQTFDFFMDRHQYGNGDSYMVATEFNYMGNVHSMAGDENGVNFNAHIRSETNVFRAAVKAWDAGAGELVFTAAQNAHTLGNSRPVINLNPAKWITQGTILVVPAESYWQDTDTGKYPYQGRTYPSTVAPVRGSGVTGLRMGGLIRGSAETPWDAGVIGRFLAIDVESEYVPRAAVPKLRRWYEITGLTVNPDGTKDLLIQRYWWGAKDAGSPTLYHEANYTWDGHERPLPYIIAPGAYVNDLRRAVGSPDQRGGIAPYTLSMTPGPVTGLAADFAPNDTIEQAIGPDPFKPQALRAWAFDHVPGAWPASMLEIANQGPVARDSALLVQGGGTTLGTAPRGLSAHVPAEAVEPRWNRAIRVASTAGVGLAFEADVAHAALLFEQPRQAQPIVWLYGDRLPGQPIAEARMTVDPATGDLRFEGGAIRAPAGIAARGLSADAATPARNLRGKNLAVDAGVTTVQVRFPVAEADADYAVFIEQSWLANLAVSAKTPEGFTVTFADAAPSGATLDWMIVR